MMNLLYHPILYNLHVLFVISDGIEEISFIKRILYENRKKTWTYYSQRLLVQCFNDHTTKFLYDIMIINLHFRLLLTCLDIQRKEVLQRAEGKLR